MIFSENRYNTFSDHALIPDPHAPGTGGPISYLKEARRRFSGTTC